MTMPAEVSGLHEATAAHTAVDEDEAAGPVSTCSNDLHSTQCPLRLVVPPGIGHLSAAPEWRIHGGSGTPGQRHERSLRLARRGAVHPPGKWGLEDVREAL